MIICIEYKKQFFHEIQTIFNDIKFERLDQSPQFL